MLFGSISLKDGNDLNEGDWGLDQRKFSCEMTSR